MRFIFIRRADQLTHTKTDGHAINSGTFQVTT